MLENSVYSVISPEGCASILWKDAAKADLAAESLRLTAEDALSFGIVERVLGDSDIGTQEFYNRIRNDLIQTLQTLSADRNLLEHRYERFRRFGRDV